MTPALSHLLEAARERPALPDVARPDVAEQIRERDRRRALTEEELFRAHGVRLAPREAA